MSKEKRDVFRKWLQHNCNFDATESNMKLVREQETSKTRNRELLTIKEMVERGFSASLISTVTILY